MAMAALKANKHIYLEKPIGHTIEEGAEIVRAAEKSNRVVQVGTQNRSNKLYIRAKQMFEDGLIGECHYVRAFWYRNFDPNQDPTTGVPAAWRYIIPADANEQNTDWKRFLEAAEHKNIPFDKNRYFQWRNYWDYSGGISTDLLVTRPTSATSSSKDRTELLHGVRRHLPVDQVEFKDDREVPDTLSALYEYPDRFHLNYSCFFGNDHFGYGEQFMGPEGHHRSDRSPELLLLAAEVHPGAKPFSKQTSDIALNAIKDFSSRCNRGPRPQLHRRRPGKAKAIAPARAARSPRSLGHMATGIIRALPMSYKQGKRILAGRETKSISSSRVVWISSKRVCVWQAGQKCA
jgi:hypothetical protein